MCCFIINAEQLLFEALFDISGNFGGVEPKSKYTFAFQYKIIFETWKSFKSPSSTPGRDGHVRLLTFLYEI